MGGWVDILKEEIKQLERKIVMILDGTELIVLDENNLDNTLMFQQCLPRARRLEVHKMLEGDTAGTADLNSLRDKPCHIVWCLAIKYY